MTDILMSDNRLPMYNGDFILTNEVEELKQHVVTALNTFYTDWLLNFQIGIDYAFGMRHEEFLEHDIKKQIKAVEGVVSILNFKMEFDRQNLKWNVVAGLKTIYGTIEVRERLG